MTWTRPYPDLSTVHSRIADLLAELVAVQKAVLAEMRAVRHWLWNAPSTEAEFAWNTADRLTAAQLGEGKGDE